MPVFLTPINLSQNELQNARIQNLATAPSSPVSGQIYYDTVQLELFYYNGSTWIPLTNTYVASVAVTAPVINSGTAIAPNLSVQAASGSQPGYLAAADYTTLHAATNLNTPSTIVERDASGNFVVNTITASSVTGLGAPVNASDAANKSYVDAAIEGLDVKNTVQAASTGSNIPLTAATPLVVDGYTLSSSNSHLAGDVTQVGDRVLLKDQTTGSQNGLYYYTVAGSTYTLLRTADAATSAQVTSGMFTFVEGGTVNNNTGYILTTANPITLGTTSLSFSQFSGAGTYTAGNGLSLTGSQFAAKGVSGSIVVSGSGIAIDPAYVGQTSITTLGTITTGVWNGTILTPTYGGLGANLTTTAGQLTGRQNLNAAGKFSANVGDGSTLTYTVTHNFNTLDVVVEVFNVSTGAKVYPDMTRASVNTVTVTFAVAPTTNQYRVTVIG
jgi:hypothetical protein